MKIQSYPEIVREMQALRSGLKKKVGAVLLLFLATALFFVTSKMCADHYNNHCLYQENGVTQVTSNGNYYATGAILLTALAAGGAIATFPALCYLVAVIRGQTEEQIRIAELEGLKQARLLENPQCADLTPACPHIPTCQPLQN